MTFCMKLVAVILHNNYLFYDFRSTFICFGEGLLSPRPTPKLEDYPLSFVRGCFSYIFTAIHHGWRSSHHPQPEYATFCADRDLPNMDSYPIG
jgi:hypothetical protein